jgi:hypothetical protein
MCRRKPGRTFSMLPHQLAPYHRYTIASMVWAAAWFCQVTGNDIPQERLLEALPPDCLATLWLVRTWVRSLRQAMAAHHHVLGAHYPLATIHAEQDTRVTDTLRSYLSAILGTGPPDELSCPAAISAMLHFCVSNRRFFMGRPSQLRQSLPAIG